MQTFAQKQKPAAPGRSGNLQMQQSGHGYDAASSAGFEFTQSATAHLTEVERTLNNSAQANAVANYQNLFDKSPRVNSVNSQQTMSANNPGFVAQAKFQNIMNSRNDALQVAQLKPDTSISSAVVQRNGDGKGSSWMDMLKDKAPWLMTGAFLGFNRAVINQSVDPLKKFGGDQAVGSAFEHAQVPLKSYRLYQNLLKIRGGGPAAYLAMAPALAGAAWFGSQAYKRYKEKE